MKDWQVCRWVMRTRHCSRLSVMSAWSRVVTSSVGSHVWPSMNHSQWQVTIHSIAVELVLELFEISLRCRLPADQKWSVWWHLAFWQKTFTHGLTVDFDSCRTSTFNVVQQLVGEEATLARVAGCRILPVGDMITVMWCDHSVTYWWWSY